jgi:hypothetical protein
MLIGDEELNFTDEEARAIDPVRRAPRPRPNHVEDEEAGGMLAALAGVVVVAVLIAMFVSAPSHSGSSANTAQSSDINQQASANNQQTSQPEYFPAGWAYVKATAPEDSVMYRGNQVIRIPLGRTFFVSLRSINGFHLAVAEDDSWNGWVKYTGAERQLPMHPDFRSAKSFVEQLDWSSFASSPSLETLSQEVADTRLDVLRASEATTERSTMLFEKKDPQQDRQEPPEITVQGEQAVIPQPLAEEKKVKLPKTKWYAHTEGASAPSSFSWICGAWEGRANKRPDGWGCTVNSARLHCVVRDGAHGAEEVHIYDGCQVVCRN